MVLCRRGWHGKAGAVICRADADKDAIWNQDGNRSSGRSPFALSIPYDGICHDTAFDNCVI